MINEQTLKIYEEIKKEHSELENKLEQTIHTFNKALKIKAVEMKDLFIKAIKETPIDKIDVTISEYYNSKPVLLKIIIPTENGNIEYVYINHCHSQFNDFGLHFKLYNTKNGYISLRLYKTQEELEMVDKFMEILIDIDTYKKDMQEFEKRIQEYTEKAKQIQEGNNE